MCLCVCVCVSVKQNTCNCVHVCALYVCDCVHVCAYMNDILGIDMICFSSTRSPKDAVRLPAAEDTGTPQQRLQKKLNLLKVKDDRKLRVALLRFMHADKHFTHLMRNKRAAKELTPHRER